MTKDDLMANFDEIVTDDRLRLDVVEDHLDSLTGDAYLFDRYHAVASGGSTGRRASSSTTGTRGRPSTGAPCATRCGCSAPRPIGRRHRLALLAVAADHATHVSSAIPQTFANSELEIQRFPVTLPLDEIVDGLNACQPALLVGYPSVLYGLANEARPGRLRIARPGSTCFAEPLLPEIRAALEETWNVPVINLYGASEFGGTASCGLGPWLHLSDDLVIIEPVDAAGRPVAPGVCSDKIYVTNLFNYTMPFIRYEVTDQLQFLDRACPCGSAHQRIADPQGRQDDCFRYGDLTVNAHVFRSVLSRQRNVVEYQVRQTAAGADVAVRCIGPVDCVEVATQITRDLKALGLDSPEITVVPVEDLERIASSGKLKRFIPLVAKG